MSKITRKFLLDTRDELLKRNPNCLMGNTKERDRYADLVDSVEISKAQRETMLGMVLSDASIDLGQRDNARLKMQQKTDNQSWLASVHEILKEYTVNSGVLPQTSPSRPLMREIVTLQSKKIHDYFDGMIETANEQKRIVDADRLKQELNALALAHCISGDGTKADHGKNKGKQIEISTQNFLEKDVECIAEIIANNFKAKVECQFDYTDEKGRDRFRIRISGKSFDSVATKVAPYIPKGMGHRLPEGRKPNSRFGPLTQEALDRLLGSQLEDIEKLIQEY